MTRFLNQGSAAIRRQREELERTGRVLTEDGVQKAREYEQTMNTLKNAIGDLARDLVLQLAPSIISVTRAMSDFLVSIGRASHSGFHALAIEQAQLIKRQRELQAALEGGGVTGWFANLDASGAKDELATVEARLTRIREILASFANPEVSGALGKAVPAPALPDLTGIADQIALIQERLGGMPDLFTAAFGTEGWAPAFIDTMRQMEDAMRAQGATAQRIALMKIQMQKREQDEVLNTASLIGSTITAVWAKSKGAAIAGATINTAVGVTKALSSHPPPYNFINAALVAAQGAAQIAAIRSTTQTGGGSVAPVGGGDAGEGGAAPAPQLLYVQGLSNNQIFGGEFVRELMQRIAEHTRDGGRVVVAPT